MIIAVDPGKSGGIAWRLRRGDYVESEKMPATERGLIDLLGGLITSRDDPTKVTVYIEKVGGFIKGRGAPGSAMFNFGWWSGGPVWIAQCYQAKVVMVTPQKWQKTLSLGKSGHDPKWKNKLKAHAERLYPGHKITLKTSDALLILAAAFEYDKGVAYTKKNR